MVNWRPVVALQICSQTEQNNPIPKFNVCLRRLSSWYCGLRHDNRRFGLVHLPGKLLHLVSENWPWQRCLAKWRKVKTCHVEEDIGSAISTVLIFQWKQNLCPHGINICGVLTLQLSDEKAASFWKSRFKNIPTLVVGSNQVKHSAWVIPWEKPKPFYWCAVCLCAYFNSNEGPS